MDTLCICWRGNPGVGKRTKLLEACKEVAESRGFQFQLHTKYLTIGSSSAQGSGEVAEHEETTGERDSETNQIAYESSVVHIGFDISRMSMQDKNILRPVLLKLGQGSQVLSGPNGRGNRILVLYHAHLLSSESVLLLQSALEQNNGDLSVWITSEIPSPLRIRDWFVEVGVSGIDKQMILYKDSLPTQTSQIVSWNEIFKKMFQKWQTSQKPILSDVPKIKAFVYELLMRNLRWVECVHFILDVILEMDGITEQQRGKCLAILASMEGTGGGQTLPSYRIPILWESLFVQLRNVLSPQQIDGNKDSTSSSRVGKKHKKIPANSKHSLEA
jgi:hypothetical protein